MLHKAVADPHALSVQPSSLGARFQLLLLCQKFIQAGVCDPVSEVLLRERLYASAATWFYYESMWYHYESGKDGYTGITDGRKELQADVKLLIDFCKSLVAEKVYLHIIIVQMCCYQLLHRFLNLKSQDKLLLLLKHAIEVISLPKNFNFILY